MTPMPSSFVRPPAVAGTWYPGDARDLTRAVDACLARVSELAVPGRLGALIVPHAGLRYSGPVAAHAYARLRGRRDLSVVLVGPSHRVAFDGCAVFARGAWATPLGVTPIDEALAARLIAAGGGLAEAPRPHAQEHSLEMQLPFLQRLVEGLRLVPVLMGAPSRATCHALALALAAAAAERRDVLLVASSDLSHYHPSAEAARLDACVVRDVRDLDAEALMRRLERRPERACGGGALVAVMQAARTLGATRAAILRYADSGDEGERDKSRVVGYLAAALVAPETQPS